MTNNHIEGETQDQTEHMKLREKLIEAHILERVLIICAGVFLIAFFFFEVFGAISNPFIFAAGCILLVGTVIFAAVLMMMDETRTLYKVLMIFEIILLVFYLFLFLWIALTLVW
jgi:hypothetical protein